jgi:hypothetical protein
MRRMFELQVEIYPHSVESADQDPLNFDFELSIILSQQLLNHH